MVGTAVDASMTIRTETKETAFTAAHLPMIAQCQFFLNTTKVSLLYRLSTYSQRAYCSMLATFLHMYSLTAAQVFIETLAVNTRGGSHELVCQGSDTLAWTRLSPEGDIELDVESSSLNVAINRPADQRKFVCHHQNKTVIKIAYVYIRGEYQYYQP